jgi:GNAT superfamily N-acetyltransferase
MEPGALAIRRAGDADLEGVLETLTEAARWEQASGLPNPWPIPFPSERIAPSLERGELFVVEDSARRTVGTVTLQWEDLPFWGPRPPDAGYVHRLAVRRAFTGRGIGGAVLDWAAESTRGRGRPYLRLDCLRSATRLHRFYESFGFRRVGDVTVGGLECALFERTLPPTGPPRTAP